MHPEIRTEPCQPWGGTGVCKTRCPYTRKKSSEGHPKAEKGEKVENEGKVTKLIFGKKAGHGLDKAKGVGETVFPRTKECIYLSNKIARSEFTNSHIWLFLDQLKLTNCFEEASPKLSYSRKANKIRRPGERFILLRGLTQIKDSEFPPSSKNHKREGKGAEKEYYCCKFNSLRQA